METNTIQNQIKHSIKRRKQIHKNYIKDKDTKNNKRKTKTTSKTIIKKTRRRKQKQNHNEQQTRHVK